MTRGHAERPGSAGCRGGLFGGGGGAGCADLDLPSEVGGASGPHAGDGLVVIGWVS